MSKRVLVGISGGIGSAVAAAILKTQGYEVIGAHLVLRDETSDKFVPASNGNCCGTVSTKQAKEVAEALEIPYYVIDVKDSFRHDVIDYVIHECLQTRTPNPCIVSNTRLKFQYLAHMATELKCDWIATGHYAKVVRNPDATEASLYRPVDKQEDQSHLLFPLEQSILLRTMFPLGDLLRSSIEKMMRTFELPAVKTEKTHELCFIDDGSYKDLIAANSSDRYQAPGPIVTQEGNIVGRHNGLYKYPLGQKKGLDLQKATTDVQDFCVIGYDMKLNCLIVGPEKELMRSSVTATNCNWIGFQDFSKGISAKARLRTERGTGKKDVRCLITRLNSNSVHIDFEEPQRAMNGGQAIIFYQEDLVVGGGWFESLTQPIVTKLRARNK